MTVVALIDELVAGRLTVEQVARRLRGRTWAPEPTHERGDVEPPDPDSWEAIATDPRLTAEQYRILAEAVTK